MCQMRPYRVVTVRRNGKEVITSQSWSGTLNGVAGSVAPMAEPLSPAYSERLTRACSARRDLQAWFWATPSDAYRAARLADIVVASVRQPGELRFSLKCTPYPADAQVRPQCEKDVRATVAGINPRAIMAVGQCGEPQAPHCVEVALAKAPDGFVYDLESDQWGLRIVFEQAGRSLNIRSVEVEDLLANLE
jgi:hypothetical protein